MDNSYPNGFNPELVRSILDKCGQASGDSTFNLAMLSFERLNQLLNSKERAVIDLLLKLDPKELGFLGPFVSMAEAPANLVSLRSQKVKREGEELALPVQFLPELVYKAFKKMRSDMALATGRRLMVESGYRTPACQAITFLTYLRLFNFDIKKVAAGVALPGYSQHGDPVSPALDLINQDGIPTDEQPQLFAETKEYSWLTKNAEKYNFYLSYPPKNEWGVIFEPWHWQYRG